MTRRRVVVVAGPPGAGKSTLAVALARQVPGSIVLDKDVITGPLVRAALRAADEPFDLDGAYYKKGLSSACYEVTETIAGLVLDGAGLPIVVAPYERAIDDAGWHDGLAARLGAEHLLVVWTYADPEIRRRRLSGRSSERDVSKLAQWDRYVVASAAIGDPPWPHWRVDTTDLDLPAVDAIAAELAAAIG